MTQYQLNGHKVSSRNQKSINNVPFYFCKMSTHLSPEMTLLLEKMKEQLNLQTNIITENITTAVLLQVEEKIKPIIEENEKLKTEIVKLNRKIDYLETTGKRNNVIIHGLPETQGESQEDLKTLVTSTLKDIDVILKEEEINRIQRLGKGDKEGGKTRPILLATTTLLKKIQILKNKKKMSPKTYITQDLSKEAQLKKKEKSYNNKKENEKRKRSETPSPKGNDARNSNDPKMMKRDAFQYLRERSHSLSEKYPHRNDKRDTASRTTTTAQ